MTAAKRETKSLISKWQIASPIFDRHLSGLDPMLGELLRKVLSQPLPPKPWIDFFFLTFVRRELR